MLEQGSILKMADGQPESAFTLRDLVRIFFRYRYTIVGCFVGVTAIVVSGLVYLPLTYTAEGKILVKTEQQAKPTLYSGVAAYSERNDFDPVDRRIETEMGILTSTVVAEEVVRRAGLSHSQVFHSPLTHFSEPVVDAGEWVLARTVGYSVDPDKRGFDDTVREFQKSIKAGVLRSRSGESTASVIEVKLPAPNAEVARTSLALLLEVYVDFERRLNAEAGTRALRIVEADARHAYADTLAKQEALRQFLAAHGAGAAVAPSASAADLADVPISRGEPQPSDGTSRSVGVTVTSPRDEQTIAQLKSRLIKMELELLELRQVFLEGSERIRDHRRNMARLRQRIDEEIASDASNYTRFGEMSRELRLAEVRYTDLQRKVDEISLFVRINSEPSGERVIILQPKKPNSSDLKRKLAIGLGGSLVGLLLGAALAGVREYVEDRVRTTDDMRRHFGIEVLAVIPRAVSGSAGREWDTAGAAVLRRLCARLDSGAAGLGTLPPDRGRTVLVTSLGAGDGTYVIAAGLAQQMRQISAGKVLLVDVCQRSADAPLGLRLAAEGVANGRKGARRGAATSPMDSDLAVLSARDDGSLFARERMQRFCAEAAQRFAWIFFDGATLDEGSMHGLISAVDLILVVVDAQDARRQVVRHSVEMLQRRRTGSIGFVLNNRAYEIPEFIYERL